MQSTSFLTRNDQKIEMFLEQHRDCFELWVVGPAGGRRTVLNHYLTRDNLYSRLRYTKTLLLKWTPAGREQIPVERSANALKDEESMESGTYWDSEDLCDHLGAAATLDIDRPAFETARRRLIGTWLDGTSVLTFGTDSYFQGSIASQPSHSFLRSVAKIEPDEWHFTDSWQLRLLNRQSRKTDRTMVHCVTESELHLAGGGNCVAFVLKRQAAA
jgi:hypothetical protein